MSEIYCKPEVGKIFIVNHSRKGKFTMKVTSVKEEWAEGLVVDGYAKAVMDYNEKYIGDIITVRISMCSFTEVKE